MADAHAKHHDYHLVDPSPWPLIGSIATFIMFTGGVLWMHDMDVLIPGDHYWLIFVGLAGVLYTMYGWWRDVVRESLAGDHTPVVQLHLRYGMILFIASEVMFFVAWFWAFFDVALFPDEAIQAARVEYTGGQWPPQGVETLDPWHLPLMNTLVLLLSGTTVTWAHHALQNGDREGLRWGLVLTIALGMSFTALQIYEYTHVTFDFKNSVYGAAFFMATGFHGFHVFVGTIFLIVCLGRVLKGHFTPERHFGFEAAAWYWHFVDVVWLFLFACIYVWGSIPHSGG